MPLTRPEIFVLVACALIMLAVWRKKPLIACAGMFLILALAPTGGGEGLVINLAVCLIALAVFILAICLWREATPTEERDLLRERPPKFAAMMHWVPKKLDNGLLAEKGPPK